MGGDEGPGAGGEEVAGDGDGQRGTFFGIGGGAQLVKQDEGAVVGQAREAVEVGDMGGEGGEGGFDGLGVADIGQESVEDGEAGGGGGDGQTCLSHHGQQGGGLEGDGFAAGVGSADDELAGLGGEFQSKRDDTATGGAKTFFKQRMAGGLKVEAAGRDGGGYTLVVAGKAGAGLQGIYQGEYARAFHKGFGITADHVSEGDEDAVDFSLFLFEKADELVVLLDGFEGLDVDGLAGGTGAVDDAGDAALELGANGNDEAVAADGDEVVLGGAVAGELAEGGAEALFDEALLALLLARMRPSSGEASSAREPSG